ncbi:MAG: aminotransferase class I/II-fold pyridoxal phosphate-dependent enzyme [Bacteroidetes bacterium]|nr:aminotransferase class I/II-fold pyridoxal phosphate-dependent enzyme [Bacteroidota bacterium]
MSSSSIIDLRSDTVTKPSPEMLDAMFHAAVGDDVFNEDPSILELEKKSAELFGKEAALFVPSGTMANQIAIKVLTNPQEEVICDKLSHIYYYESGGVAFNSGTSMRLLDGDRGRITPEQILDNINDPNAVYMSTTSLVSIENTCNKGGGSYYTLKQMEDISSVCRKNNLHVHLDGARIFNAITETNDAPHAIGKLFDTISFCFSKGLGAPVGSVLLSSKEKILKARKIRKAWGGGMRQAGYLAAAGIYALDHNRVRLKEDHLRARKIGGILSALSFVEKVLPVDTNIIVFTVSPGVDVKQLLSHLADRQIKVVPFGKQTIRMVTHLDIHEEMLEEIERALTKY